jgi:tetratricopeptide (TPR) repeat protein
LYLLLFGCKIKNIFLYIFFVITLVVITACSSEKIPTISRSFIEYLNDTIPLHRDNYKDGQNDATDYFINGAQLEQQQYYADAIIEYLEALRLDTNAVIYYALGKNYYFLKRYGRAEEYLAKSVELDSTMTPALKKLGDLYLHTYRRRDAQRVFEELAEINPNIENINKLAYLYEFSEPEKAAELYEQLREKNENYFILIKLASIYQELGDTTLYIERLEQAYSYSKDDGETVIQLITAYLASGQIDKALNLLERTNERMLTPELEYLYLSLGSSLMDKYDSTYSPFKKSFTGLIDSRFYYNWQLQSMAGIIASQINDTLAAEKFFKRAMNAADSIPEISLQLANHYIVAGKNAKAIKILDEYISAFPSDERFPNLMGMAYYMSDSIKKAINCFHKSININPENSEAFTQLGIAYDRLGKYDSSDFYYERVLELDMFDPLVNNNYAYSLSLRNKDLDRALKMSKRALQSDPDNASYLDTYGWILFGQEKYDDALEYINKAIEAGGASAEVYLHLGEIYLKKGEKESAIEAWNKGLKLEPGNKDLLERLDGLKR